MKYPVYIEVFHKSIGSTVHFRELVHNDEEVEKIYMCLSWLEKNNPGYSFRYAGYPSVVGNLPTGRLAEIIE